MIKFLLIILIIYFGGKVIKSLLNPKQTQNEVKGVPKKSKPIDLSNTDIEDAEFEEIDE